MVTFRYKESATDHIKTSEVSAQEFIRRFLQHVLPKRFTKVRYYGLLSPSNRRLLIKARELLGPGRTKTSAEPSQEQQEQIEPRLCPECGGEPVFVRRLSPLGPTAALTI